MCGKGHSTPLIKPLGKVTRREGSHQHMRGRRKGKLRWYRYWWKKDFPLHIRHLLLLRNTGQNHGRANGMVTDLYYVIRPLPARFRACFPASSSGTGVHVDHCLTLWPRGLSSIINENLQKITFIYEISYYDATRDTLKFIDRITVVRYCAWNSIWLCWIISQPVL